MQSTSPLSSPRPKSHPTSPPYSFLNANSLNSEAKTRIDPYSSPFTLKTASTRKSSSDQPILEAFASTLLEIVEDCLNIDQIKDLNKTISSWDHSIVIPEEDITLGGALGVGAFGSVYFGSYNYTSCAVKKINLRSLSPKQIVTNTVKSRHLRSTRLVIFCS